MLQIIQQISPFLRALDRLGRTAEEAERVPVAGNRLQEGRNLVCQPHQLQLVRFQRPGQDLKSPEGGRVFQPVVLDLRQVRGVDSGGPRQLPLGKPPLLPKLPHTLTERHHQCPQPAPCYPNVELKSTSIWST